MFILPRTALDGTHRRILEAHSNDLPPQHTVYEQAQRWITAGSFEAIVHDLRELLRVAGGRNPKPTATVLDGRTLRATPESGTRVGFDGHQKTKGYKVHVAVNMLGHRLAVLVTPANEQESAQVGALAAKVQEATQQNVTLAFVDQGYTGEVPAKAAKTERLRARRASVPRPSRPMAKAANAEGSGAAAGANARKVGPFSTLPLPGSLANTVPLPLLSNFSMVLSPELATYRLPAVSNLYSRGCERREGKLCTRCCLQVLSDDQKHAKG